MEAQAIKVSDLYTRAKLSKYFLRVLRQTRDGRILDVDCIHTGKAHLSTVMLICHEDLARVLVLSDVFDKLQPKRKAMAELFERLEPIFSVKHSKAVDLSLAPGLFLSIDVAGYVRKAREILK